MNRRALTAWAGSAEHFVGPDMADAIEVLKDLCAEMDRRYSVLLGSGLRKIDRDGEFGLHVVAIDELAFYMRSGTKDERNELSETLRDVISRGRAAGIIVIAATQKPSNDIVPTYVRDLFSFRMALRCTTPEASDTILGQGWAKEGFSASTLDPTVRGVGYLLAEGAVPVKVRTHYLDDDAIAALARAGRDEAEPAVSSAAHWRSVLAEVDEARLCVRPVRLRGITLDRSTGELAEGTILVACKDRRAAVCPSCSRLYQADAWQLVAAGIRGGKGVDPTGCRAPSALRHLHRPALRPRAPRRRSPRPKRPVSPPALGCSVSPRASRSRACDGTATRSRWSASRCAPSASTTAGRCCGTRTSRGCGTGRCSGSTSRWPGERGLSDRSCARRSGSRT